MTLLEDTQAEYEEMIGESMTHYPAKQPVDEGDDFWHKEDGWDKQNGTAFTGVVQTSKVKDMIKDEGFDEETTAAVRTGFNGAETGDLIEYDGREWVILNKSPLRAEGKNYSTILAVRELK